MSTLEGDFATFNLRFCRLVRPDDPSERADEISGVATAEACGDLARQRPGGFSAF